MIAKMAFGLCGRLVHVGQKWAVLPAPCLAVLKILSLPVVLQVSLGNGEHLAKPHIASPDFDAQLI